MTEQTRGFSGTLNLSLNAEIIRASKAAVAFVSVNAAVGQTQSFLVYFDVKLREGSSSCTLTGPSSPHDPLFLRSSTCSNYATL